MRPLIVLALAPILALGLALGAGQIVPDKPPKATLKPKSIVWNNRVFTSPTTFARWLGARDKSYQVWVQRHPGATWFHKVRPVGARPALAAPKGTVTKSEAGGGTDMGLVILVGLGGLVLGGAIMRILPSATGGAVNRRRRALRSPPAPASVGVPRRLALPAPKPPPPRTAPIYAPPRVYPEPAAHAHEPARVVPLYIPPEPEPEPASDRVAASAPDRVVAPTPTPAEREPQPLYIPPEPEPEVAPAFEPSRVAASAPEPVVAPTPIPREPEPQPAVNGEPFLAPVVEPAPLIEAAPLPVPDPTPLAVPEPPPAPLPEPEVVIAPAPPTAPAEEPPLEPAATVAVPAPEPQPAPEPEPEPTLDRPARTTVMPASAPAGTDWDTCEIALWEGYVKSQFYARVTTPEGDEFALAFSPHFRVRNPFARDEVARSAHVQLAQQLLEGGWKPDGRGKYWWELRFTLEEAAS